MHLEGAHGLVLLATILAAKIVVLVSDDFERLVLERVTGRELALLEGGR